MAVTLYEKPQKPIILQGFPGVGLVGSIVTEFLINQPGVRRIGHIFDERMQPLVVVHDGQVLHPAGIYFNENYNLVIVHIIAQLNGFEWVFADELLNLFEQLQAWELVSVEGVASQNQDSVVLGLANTDDARRQLEEKNVKPLNEGLIFGVSAALALKAREKHTRMLGLYATTHTGLPDSTAAAHVIQTLDALYDYNIDSAPLEKMAQEFEQKVKTLMSKSAQASDMKQQMNYVG